MSNRKRKTYRLRQKAKRIAIMATVCLVGATILFSLIFQISRCDTFVMHVPLINYIALISLFFMYVGSILYQVRDMDVDHLKHIAESPEARSPMCDRLETTPDWCECPSTDFSGSKKREKSLRKNTKTG